MRHWTHMSALYKTGNHNIKANLFSASVLLCTQKKMLKSIVRTSVSFVGSKSIQLQRFANPSCSTSSHTCDYPSHSCLVHFNFRSTLSHTHTCKGWQGGRVGSQLQCVGKNQFAQLELLIVAFSVLYCATAHIRLIRNPITLALFANSINSTTRDAVLGFFAPHLQTHIHTHNFAEGSFPLVWQRM